MANVLPTPKRVAIVNALIEGCSIRATARMVGVSKDTVMKLQRALGEACIEYMNEAMVDLPCQKLQVDEVWSFCYSKQKDVPQERKDEIGVGDVWTFTAIDAESKLIPTFLVGSRDTGTATEFLQDLASRISHRAQLTTDGHKMYLSAVEDAFGTGIDYAQLVKIYGAAPEGEKRYSPAECIGRRTEARLGNSDPKHVSTSYVERANLTIRRSVRRFTRLTNAFSKKVENHVAALGMLFAFYNFCRPHQSRRTKSNNRVTPAMAAGIADRQWETEDLVALLPEEGPKKRGPYKKQTSNYDTTSHSVRTGRVPTLV